MPRPSNTAQRRNEIVSGLLRAMARQGYAEASVAEIARAAKLTPGLLHYHFRSKKEILLALIDHLSVVLRTRIESRLARASGPRGQLFAFLDAHVAMGPDADPDAVACWVQVAAEALRDRDVRGSYERGLREDLGRLEGLLRETLQEEERSPARVRELASGLLSAIQGAYQLGVGSPGIIPKGSMAVVLREMAEGLLASQPLLPSKGVTG